MKIIALQAENIKRLIAVEIHPDGNLVQITGKNGQGKTSVLDSIWWALAGAKHIQAAPIRKGANHARIRLDMGEIVVTRTFKKDDEGGFTTKLEVVGNVKGSPQGMLDTLLDSLAFDPLKFARMDSREQFDALKKYVPGVDFDKFAAETSIDMANRKDINRQAKEARVLADQIEVPANAPTEAVDEAALVAKLTEAGEHNAHVQIREERRKQLEAGAAAKISRAAGLRKEADSLEREANDDLARLQAAGALPDMISVDAIQAEIKKARETNAIVVLRHRKAQYETKAGGLEKSSKEITERIAKREEEKIAAIAKAELPIESLTLGEGVVLLNGVPFEQASDAEQLKASCALAMAGNPQLRVLRVRDGSLLDEDALALLAKMAGERDYQVWIERVGTGDVGFILEDGHIIEREKQQQQLQEALLPGVTP